MRNPHWSGYIHYDNKIVPIQIYAPEKGEEEYGATVWVDDVLVDETDGTPEDFVNKYSDRFYNTLEDFKVTDWLSVNEVWPIY